MYRIRRAAELAGVTPELLRAWERRYGLVAPERTEAGYRVYSDADVQVLRGAKRLVDGGQSIGDVAQIPKPQLVEAAGRPRQLPSIELVDQPALPLALSGLDMRPAIKEAVDAIADFDQNRLETALFRVMGLGNLHPEQICEGFLLPLLKTLGDEWEASRLSIAAEHFGSTIIRGKILRLLEHQRINPDAAVVVCACPTGEEHEGALLAFAVSAGCSGMRVVYLGADTPTADIVGAAEYTKAVLIALSLTTEPSDDNVRALIAALTPWRDSSEGRQIMVGGKGAQRSRSRFEAAGVHVVDNATLALSIAGEGTAQ